MSETEKLPYVGYVIDLGTPFTDKQKLVIFRDGVGVLDYQAVASERPEWFEFDTAGDMVGVKPCAVSMQAFVDYWNGRGAKVTEISKTEAERVKKALAASEPIDNKYLKVPVDTRKIAKGGKKAEAEPKPKTELATDITPDEKEPEERTARKGK